MTKEQLDAIRARYDNAQASGDYPATPHIELWISEAWDEFYFECKKDVPALLSEVERLRAALREIVTVRYTMSQALNAAHVHELTADKMRAIANAALEEEAE